MRTPRRKEPTAIEVLNQLDAERLIVTTQIRTALMRSYLRLLPQAQRQARQGKPALLRLITRAAFRDVNPDRAAPKRRAG